MIRAKINMNSGRGNYEKFSARKRAMNYYSRKPPTTNSRIAHGVYLLASSPGLFSALNVLRERASIGVGTGLGGGGGGGGGGLNVGAIKAINFFLN